MTVDQIVNGLVSATLMEMMFALGLGVAIRDLLALDWRTTLRGLLANYVGVPAATLLLLVAFEADPMIAVGFMILAACSGAPYGPPLTALAKGDVCLAVSLMTILAASSAVLAPFLLEWLLPIVVTDSALNINGTQVALTLLVTQLLPLAAGIFTRATRPGSALRLIRPAQLISKVLNLLAVGAILVTQFHLFAGIGLKAFAGIANVAGCQLVDRLVAGQRRECQAQSYDADSLIAKCRHGSGNRDGILSSVRRRYGNARLRRLWGPRILGDRIMHRKNKLIAFDPGRSPTNRPRYQVGTRRPMSRRSSADGCARRCPKRTHFAPFNGLTSHPLLLPSHSLRALKARW
jgi:bile acid:Na+ symporter, BASS family